MLCCVVLCCQVGLTASVVHDPETRELVLESGALVLSDNGASAGAGRVVLGSGALELSGNRASSWEGWDFCCVWNSCSSITSTWSATSVRPAGRAEPGGMRPNRQAKLRLSGRFERQRFLLAW